MLPQKRYYQNCSFKRRHYGVAHSKKTLSKLLSQKRHQNCCLKKAFTIFIFSLFFLRIIRYFWVLSNMSLFLYYISLFFFFNLFTFKSSFNCDYCKRSMIRTCLSNSLIVKICSFITIRFYFGFQIFLL